MEMKGLAIFAIALLLEAAALPAQAEKRIRDLLTAGRDDEAAAELARRLSAAEDEPARGRILDASWVDFRQSGASWALLGALNEAVARAPAAPVLRYYRGSLLRDLKLVEGAKEDFAKALQLDPGTKSLAAELAWAHVLGFEHERAAELFAQAGMTEEASQQSRLARALEQAPERQLSIALAGLLLAALIAALALRLARSAPR